MTSSGVQPKMSTMESEQYRIVACSERSAGSRQSRAAKWITSRLTMDGDKGGVHCGQTGIDRDGVGRKVCLPLLSGKVESSNSFWTSG
jgi:hypothetical protein